MIPNDLKKKDEKVFTIPEAIAALFIVFAAVNLAWITLSSIWPKEFNKACFMLVCIDAEWGKEAEE